MKYSPLHFTLRIKEILFKIFLLVINIQQWNSSGFKNCSIIWKTVQNCKYSYWFGLIFLFNCILTFGGYLKPSLRKDISGLAGVDKEVHTFLL